MKNYWFLAALAFLSACQIDVKNLDDQSSALDTAETYRPAYHFTPQAHWMNDPNGMFFKDGTYHLYFQYYPEGNQWGPMHWGHATSKDLYHWTEHPIAIYPDSALGYIFSGSAVIDTFNISGLGLEGTPPIIAMYTFHKRPGDVQTQGISYSLDGGMTYSFYEGNPVLPNPGLQDFRDPKMMWDGERWICTMTVGQEIAFYASDNLLDWTPLSQFKGEHGNHGGVWECPELFSLTTADGTRKDILFVSIGKGAFNGGSGTQYFVGHWDGNSFTAEHEDIRYLDWGRDNYAGVNWWNAPVASGSKLFVGWMSNWDYSQKVPTYKWRSSMTLPRTLSLENVNGQFFIVQDPVFPRPENAEHNRTRETYESIPVPNAVIWNLKTEPIWSATFSSPSGDTLKVFTTSDSLYIDRSGCGIQNFHEDFGKRMAAPLHHNGKKLKMALDVMSLEVFAEDGLSVMTATFFPHEPFTKVYFTGIEAAGTTTYLKL